MMNDPDEARRLANGGRLAAAAGPDPQASTLQASTPQASTGAQAPTAAFAPDGTLIALVAEESGQARPLVVFA